MNVTGHCCWFHQVGPSGDFSSNVATTYMNVSLNHKCDFRIVQDGNIHHPLGRFAVQHIFLKLDYLNNCRKISLKAYT